jgi:predicted ester cyclase
MDTYPTIAHLWFGEVWNKGNAAVIDEMLTPDIVSHGLLDANGEEVNSIDRFKVFYRQFRETFPDIQVHIERAVTEGNETVALCRVEATHAGGAMGFAPTNRRVTFKGSCWFALRDGKIAEVWNNFDFLNLYQQIGVVKPNPL